MQPANAHTVLGNFKDATFTQFGVVTRFFEKEGRFWINTEGPDGTLRDYPILVTRTNTPLPVSTAARSV